MKYNSRINGNLLFDKYHPNPLSKVQQPFTILECKTLVVFTVFLSTNKNAEDIFRRSHPKTDTRRNNIALILFALFIPQH